MKSRNTCLLVCLIAFAVRAANSVKNAGFEKMKTLVGEWRGKTQDGNDITVSYRLVAAGADWLSQSGASAPAANQAGEIQPLIDSERLVQFSRNASHNSW